MGDRGARREAGGDHERERQTDRDRQRGKRMGREMIAVESTEGREGREREIL